MGARLKSCKAPLKNSRHATGDGSAVCFRAFGSTTKLSGAEQPTTYQTSGNAAVRGAPRRLAKAAISGVPCVGFWRTRFGGHGRHGRASRRSIRFARLEPERRRLPNDGVLIAAFRGAAPARCGAFTDERRIERGLRNGRLGLEIITMLKIAFGNVRASGPAGRQGRTTDGNTSRLTKKRMSCPVSWVLCRRSNPKP